jgi:hypothetical protein
MPFPLTVKGVEYTLQARSITAVKPNPRDPTTSIVYILGSEKGFIVEQDYASLVSDWEDEMSKEDKGV